MFLALSRVGFGITSAPGVWIKRLCALLIVLFAAVGSARYYGTVLNKEGLLQVLKEAHFDEVCRRLEETKGKRILIYDNDMLLTPWLCYHAHRDAVYVDESFIIPTGVSRTVAFSVPPDISTIGIKVFPSAFTDLQR
jgi:hypothetical protein